MTIYRFDNESLVDEVTVHHTEGGGMRAYLHARDGASQDALNALKKSLTEHTLQSTPIQEDGKPVLEVRGLRNNEASFLHLLSRVGAVSGTPARLSTPDDKIGFKEKLKKNTLTLSGLSYFAGDISYLSYGLRESMDSGQHFSTAAGIFYALGSPFLVFFGRGDKSDIQLKHMSYNLIKDLQSKRIRIPEDSALHNVANGHNTTTWKKIHSFCSRYPAEIANSVFAGAGSMIMIEKALEIKKWNWHAISDYKAGGLKAVNNFLNHKEAGKHARWSVLMDIGLGSMTVAAGLLSVLIEEEAPRKGEPKKTGWAGFMQKIRQHPLAAASSLLMVATGAHAASTYVDWREAKALKRAATISEPDLAKIKRLEGSLTRRGIFVGSNILAEVIMGLSSKGHGAGVRSDNSLDHSAYAVAADLVQRADPDKRGDLVEKISAFYAQKKHLSSDPAVIKNGILKELATLDANPWIGVMASQSAPVEKTVKSENYWRDRAINAPQAVATAPAL